MDRRGVISCFTRTSPARDSTSSVLLLLGSDQNLLQQLQGEDHRDQRWRQYCESLDDQEEMAGGDQDEGPDDAGRPPKSCLPTAFFKSWPLLSLLLAKRPWPGLDSSPENRRKNSTPTSSHDQARDSSRSQAAIVANAAVWRIMAKRIVSEVHCRRRRMVRQMSGGLMARKKGIDFAYDEGSYAKNFDMGRENWIKSDPCLAVRRSDEIQEHQDKHV
ncbi:hypothetical protein SELMODRAFT_427440 [Selaginella moellendorffii]|uniref:Uncharacterized protein n=1 Tax=Selaginella moellendorffii TaxID=88036 RepID=D8SZM5_SELML|nr:hypothetical protein SELMODRAFT_427440 [Selaginella moellendorffii]